MKRIRCSPVCTGVKNRWRGFTLVELLVVIAIISILAAILFPVFSSAREKSRQATCTSNLKQMTLGMLQYVSDFDEMYPYAYIYGTINGTPNICQTWQEVIYPYVKSNQVYICPDTAVDIHNFNPATYCANSFTTCSSTQYYNTSYGLNASAFTPGAGLLASTIPKPDQLIMVADEYYGGPGVYGTGSLGGDGQITFSQNFTSRHTKGVNVGFCDGHVKWAVTSTYFTQIGPPGEAYVYKYWLIGSNNQ